MQTLEVASNKARPIDPEAVRQLYVAVGWWPERQMEDIALVLRAELAFGAWDGDHLVGFTRVVSDGRLRAFIEDVVVHPDYRRLGIGSQLLKSVVQALDHIEIVTLFCEPGLVPFYERHGFKARHSQVVMHRRRPQT